MNTKWLVAALIGVSCAAPSRGQSSQPTSTAFDACGVLIRGTECVLFEGGGGKYYVVGDFGRFKVGDTVRVVGDLNPDCTTICNEGDGCIANAEIFDPALLPCGTPAHVQFDPCAGLSTTALAGALACMLQFARTRRKRN